MQPLQTTEGIVLVGNIDDLKDLIVEKCGYEVYDFIKNEKSIESMILESEIDDLEASVSFEIDFRKEIADELYDANAKIIKLEKELKQLKPDPVIAPIESLKKPIALDELDDEECIPF